jgi:hypothetical protein
MLLLVVSSSSARQKHEHVQQKSCVAVYQYTTPRLHSLLSNLILAAESINSIAFTAFTKYIKVPNKQQIPSE